MNDENEEEQEKIIRTIDIKTLETIDIINVRS